MNVKYFVRVSVNYEIVFKEKTYSDTYENLMWLLVVAILTKR